MLKLSTLAKEIEENFPKVPPPEGKSDDWKAMNTVYFFCHYDMISLDISISGTDGGIHLRVDNKMTLVEFRLQLERELSSKRVKYNLNK